MDDRFTVYYTESEASRPVLLRLASLSATLRADPIRIVRITHQNAPAIKRIMSAVGADLIPFAVFSGNVASGEKRVIAMINSYVENFALARESQILDARRAWPAPATLGASGVDLYHHAPASQGTAAAAPRPSAAASRPSSAVAPRPSSAVASRPSAAASRPSSAATSRPSAATSRPSAVAPRPSAAAPSAAPAFSLDIEDVHDYISGVVGKMSGDDDASGGVSQADIEKYTERSKAVAKNFEESQKRRVDGKKLRGAVENGDLDDEMMTQRFIDHGNNVRDIDTRDTILAALRGG